MTVSGDARPRLAPGTRLKWEPARETHLLLFPEGALALNETAAAVLELCDGERTVSAIVSELEGRYPGSQVGSDVRDLLARIAERGLVTDVA